MAGQDFAFGKYRLPLAILKADGESVIDRAADIEVNYGPINSGEERELSELVWQPWPVRNGVYVGYPVFEVEGIWEFRVTLKEGGKELRGSAAVEVRRRPLAPEVGEPAPLAETKTAATALELRRITSATEPDPDLYRVSLADAFKSGRPTIVSFSTPAFCTTQTCGPQIEVISKLQDRHGEIFNFVHVEIWDNPREMLDTGDASIGRLSPAVAAWELPSEPWTFLVDFTGRVRYRFEGFTTESELEETIQEFLNS